MKLKPIQSQPTLPPRPSTGHKGTFGTVIVVGGQPTMIGAPAFCALAALRTGAGLTKIATSPKCFPHILTIAPSATGVALDLTNVQRSLDLLMQNNPNQKTVFAIGPGLGQSNFSAQLTRALFNSNRPLVIDADGLNLLAKNIAPLATQTTPAILTPHLGEFKRLAQAAKLTYLLGDHASLLQAAAKLAQYHQCIVVLKGSPTITTDGIQYHTNTTGNVALATAGSGDVLTGMIASFLAQNKTPLDAAVLGVHLHGLAADIWAKKHGDRGLLAQELTAQIPNALASYVDF